MLSTVAFHLVNTVHRKAPKATAISFLMYVRTHTHGYTAIMNIIWIISCVQRFPLRARGRARLSFSQSFLMCERLLEGFMFKKYRQRGDSHGAMTLPLGKQFPQYSTHTHTLSVFPARSGGTGRLYRLCTQRRCRALTQSRSCSVNCKTGFCVTVAQGRKTPLVVI